MANTAGEMREDQGSSKRALGDMAMGFFRGKVLCAAVRLGIADALANGSMTVDELAAQAIFRSAQDLPCSGSDGQHRRGFLLWLR